MALIGIAGDVQKAIQALRGSKISINNDNNTTTSTTTKSAGPVRSAAIKAGNNAEAAIRHEKLGQMVAAGCYDMRANIDTVQTFLLFCSIN